MIVTLDGERVDGAFGPDCTLQTLLDEVREDHLDDRLIVSVAVNGQRLDSDDLRTQLDQPVDHNAQLDLESGDRLGLVREALRGLAEEFGGASHKYERMADQLSGGEVSEGVRGVGDFVSLWQTCYKALTECSALLGEDLTLVEHDGRTVRDWLQDVVDKLTELREALDSHDVVLMSDLMRYELLPQCEAWKPLLDGLVEHVGSAHERE